MSCYELLSCSLTLRCNIEDVEESDDDIMDQDEVEVTYILVIRIKK